MFNAIRNLFKKKPKQKEIPQEIIDLVNEKYEIGKLNRLTPKQIEETILHNKDIDFLDEELKEQMNYPDERYLIHTTVPHLKSSSRKNIEPKDIVIGAIIGDVIGSKYEFADIVTQRPSMKNYHQKELSLPTILFFQ